MKDVLIVEPSEDLAIIIAQSLARQERSYSMAHTAQSAVQQADTNTPRLVILELLMPKHNGLEFIHEFRSYSEWSEIPIVIYSQLPKDEMDVDPAVLNDMGIVAHLYKPTSSLAELTKTVEKFLG